MDFGINGTFTFLEYVRAVEDVKSRRMLKEEPLFSYLVVKCVSLLRNLNLILRIENMSGIRDAGR